jgi:hypothetical protein
MKGHHIKTVVLKNLGNIPGWSTKRRLLVFESDDWGTIRSTSIEAINRLISKGIDFQSLDAERFSYNDTLATAEDLSALFDILLSVRDINSKPAVFTAISLVANPDFNAIRNSDFMQYYYEPFTETLKRYPGCENSFELWKQGIKEGIFVPQFHGREHLNIASWMAALRDGHPETIEVFNESMWGYVNRFYNERTINYQEAFNIHSPTEIALLEEVLKDGLDLFEKLFGYRASLFVPPNGPFSNKLEKSLALNGIIYISQYKIQSEPTGFGKTRRVLHYLGMKNKFDQIYITRNCVFEPSNVEITDWVGKCMRDIECAFRWHKPAIISSHRVNYIGGLNIKNRQNNLRQLKEMLESIMKRWPNVEFISSDQLGSIILDDKNK